MLCNMKVIGERVWLVRVLKTKINLTHTHNGFHFCLKKSIWNGCVGWFHVHKTNNKKARLTPIPILDHTTHIPKLHLDFVKADYLIRRRRRRRRRRRVTRDARNSQSSEILHQKSKVRFLKNICSKKKQ